MSDIPSNHTFGPLLPETHNDKNKVVTGSRRSGWRDLGSTVLILGMAVFVAFLIIAFVFRSYEVDGPSMESTLQNSDKLIIWKVPRTVSDITGHPYIPNRGDII